MRPSEIKSRDVQIDRILSMTSPHTPTHRLKPKAQA
jgi:hypothetical protein